MQLTAVVGAAAHGEAVEMDALLAPVRDALPLGHVTLGVEMADAVRLVVLGQ